MKNQLAVSAVIALLLCIPGCGQPINESSSASPGTSSAYPKDAAAVTSDVRFKLAFKSGQTGISYYVRRLAKNEVSQMPEDSVITSEHVSLVLVPIKDGKIVAATSSDRVALRFEMPPEMLK